MNQILKYVSLSRLSLKDKDLLEQAYLQAFPASERRPWTDIVQPQYTVSLALAVYERELLCGMLHLWHMEGGLFVEYLFVLESYRNVGVGRRVIVDLINQLPPDQYLVLEAEPAEAGFWAKRRLSFYRRCGLFPLNLAYYQPAFDGSLGKVPLHLLSNQWMSEDESVRIAERIHSTVYGAEFIISK